MVLCLSCQVRKFKVHFSLETGLELSLYSFSYSFLANFEFFRSVHRTLKFVKLLSSHCWIQPTDCPKPLIRLLGTHGMWAV